MRANVFFVIPARGGSKRLHRKNLRHVLGKPLIQYAVEACQGSKFHNGKNVFVTTEDEEISKESKRLSARVIDRPQALAADDVWTQDVIEHAVTKIEGFDKSEESCIVVRVQANSPQVTSEKIDECIEKLLAHDLWEVFTIDEQLLEDAAVHALRAKCVAQRALSVYKGVVMTDYIDVHNESDLLEVARRMKAKNDKD